MNFCTTLYGNSYVRFLYAQIGSIKLNSPESNHYIIYNDVDYEFLSPFEKDSKIKLIELSGIDINQNQDLFKIISSKVHFWREALKNLPDGPIIMLDVDTRVNYNFINYKDYDFDIGFTIKKEQFPLNTGVLLINNCFKVKSFFDAWTLATDEIIYDPVKLKISKNRKYRYGGADQMSFQKLIEFDPDNESYIEILNGLKFAALDCNIYNQTKSVPLNKNIKIFHLKGAWHNVINEGYSFNKKRTLKDSFEILDFFEKCLNKTSLTFQISNYYSELNIPYFKNGVVSKINYWQASVLYLIKKYRVSILRKVFSKYRNVRI